MSAEVQVAPEVVAPPAAAPPEVPQVDPFEAKFAKLASKEADLQKQSQALKAQAQEVAILKEALKLKDTDPVGFLARVGLDTAKLASAQKLAEDPTAKRLAQLEQKLEQQEKERTALQDKAIQDSWRAEVVAEIGKTEKHEFVKMEPVAVDQIMEVMRQHYDKTKEVLDYASALEQVESRLETQMRERVTKSKKIKEWVSPTLAQAPAVEVIAPPESQTRTLTNSLTTTTAPQTAALTAEERLARASRILEEGWKR